MSWLTNFVRPKIQAFVRRSQVRESLWEKCPSCEQMIFHRELAERFRVCPHCEHHMWLPPKDRLAHLFDLGDYEMLEMPSATQDPLKFRDRKKYVDRLKEAQGGVVGKDAIVAACGEIGGNLCIVSVLDFAFMAGSMGVAVGNGFLQAAKTAIDKDAPLIIFSASGGARMQEGILSLMQMPRTIVALNTVKEAKLPYIVVLTNPTTGGVTASFAMLGDVTIAEPGALIGFAGPRVIEDTIREKLPEGFQRSEYLEDHGMVDIVVPRSKLPGELARVIDILVNKNSADRSELASDYGRLAGFGQDEPESASKNPDIEANKPV